MDNNLKILRVPSGWNEVPILMYQELAGLDYTDGTASDVELIYILSDRDPEDIEKINASNLDSILQAISWTNTSPKEEYKTEVVIDNVTYYLVKLSSLSTGEQIDVEKYSSDITMLHKFFAVIYRPPNEVYSVEKMLKRSELFSEKLMIEDVYGSLLFFLSIASKYEMIIQEFTKMQQTKKK